MEHIDYMEREAAKNYNFHIDDMAELKKDATNLMTVLYFLIVASFSTAVNIFASKKAIAWGVLLCAICVYLTALAVYLLFTCLKDRPVKLPANEPKNLVLQPGADSNKIRELELKNLQERIDFNKERNRITSTRLHNVRLSLVLSPVAFLTIFLLLYALAPTQWF